MGCFLFFSPDFVKLSPLVLKPDKIRKWKVAQSATFHFRILCPDILADRYKFLNYE